MEEDKLYKKIGRKYVSVGFQIPDISDGIWIVKSNPGSKRITSLIWKVGDIKRPADVTTHVAIQSMEDDLVDYLNKLGDVSSPEYQEAKKVCGVVQGPINLNNVSASDFITLLLREISKKIEDGR
jgi:hypothetical protein